MHLFAPPSIQDFDSRHVVKSAWIDHACFGYDLIAAVRPSLLVELGTNQGMSYFTFCQSMKAHTVDGLCYAVDTWTGDQHIGKYSESVFKSVEQLNRDNYGSFSYLMRMSFEAAAPLFADESIDLLHIDGTHTEEAVRKDFMDWFPKVKPGGVVLLHDIEVYDDDFGVWKLWQEVSQAFPSFAFSHGYGLGVLRKAGGPVIRQRHQLLDVLFNGETQDHQRIREYYEHAAQFQGMKRKLAAAG